MMVVLVKAGRVENPSYHKKGTSYKLAPVKVSRAVLAMAGKAYVDSVCRTMEVLGKVGRVKNPGDHKKKYKLQTCAGGGSKNLLSYNTLYLSL